MPIGRDANGRLVARSLADPVPDKVGSPTVGAAPINAQYLTLALDATLTAERRFVPAARLSGTDGGAGGDYTLDLANLGVAAGPTGGAATAPIVTIDNYGRVTALSSAAITPAAIGAQPLDTDLTEIAAVANVRGDLLVTDSTPSWVRLGIGTNNTFLKSNGTDPAWTAGAALTKVDDTNVTLTLGGSATSALVNAASLTLGWTGTLAAGRLNSNVVQGVTNDTNVTGSIAAQNLTLGWTGTLAAARLNANVVQAITNDTNITGSIAAQNLTLGWTGTLAAARLNSNVVQAITNDTNVTGSIAAQNLTLGWTGTLAIARGGTGAGTATAAFNALSPLTTRGDLLTRDATNNVRLGIGAANTVLKTDGTDASWAKLVAANCGSTTGSTDQFVFGTAPTFTTNITTPLIYGGPANTDNLDLYANDEAIAQSNTGRIRLYERAKLHVGYAGGTGSTSEGLLVFDNSYTAASATTVYALDLTPTITVNNLFGHLFQGVRYAPTTSHTTGTSVSNTIVFQNAASLRATSTGTNPPGCISFDDFVTFYSSTSSATTALTEAFSFRSRPSVTSTGAGSVLTITDYFQHDAAFTMTTDNATGAVTVTTRRGYYVRDASLSGAGTETLTTQVGFDVAALAAATNNIGIRNASTTVFTEAVSTISAASSTIASSATLIRLNNTSGGAVTLSSTPHIANGQDGQLLIIYNGSTNAVTISDQGTVASSGLRLVTSTIALGTRDSVMLVYSSSIGDWIQIGAGTPTTASGGSNVI